MRTVYAKELNIIHWHITQISLFWTFPWKYVIFLSKTTNLWGLNPITVGISVRILASTWGLSLRWWSSSCGTKLIHVLSTKPARLKFKSNHSKRMHNWIGEEVLQNPMQFYNLNIYFKVIFILLFQLIFLLPFQRYVGYNSFIIVSWMIHFPIAAKHCTVRIMMISAWMNLCYIIVHCLVLVAPVMGFTVGQDTHWCALCQC